MVDATATAEITADAIHKAIRLELATRQADLAATKPWRRGFVGRGAEYAELGDGFVLWRPARLFPTTTKADRQRLVDRVRQMAGRGELGILLDSLGRVRYVKSLKSKGNEH